MSRPTPQAPEKVMPEASLTPADPLIVDVVPGMHDGPEGRAERGATEVLAQRDPGGDLRRRCRPTRPPRPGRTRGCRSGSDRCGDRRRRASRSRRREWSRPCPVRGRSRSCRSCRCRPSLRRPGCRGRWRPCRTRRLKLRSWHSEATGPNASVAAGARVLEEQAGRTAVHHLACAFEPEAGAGAAVVRFLGAGAAVGVGDEEGPIHLTGDGNFHRLCRHRGREGASDGYSKCLLVHGVFPSE